MVSERFERRAARRQRVRRKVQGSDKCPRLSVFRSLKHIYVQVISDQSGRTLTAVSTQDATVKGALARSTSSLDAAKMVGKTIAERCKEKGIEAVVFDRNGFLYHGRVKALADAAREAGLRF
jgi:large subunit ribosomal protein L18